LEERERLERREKEYGSNDGSDKDIDITSHEHFTLVAPVKPTKPHATPFVIPRSDLDLSIEEIIDVTTKMEAVHNKVFVTQVLSYQRAKEKYILDMENYNIAAAEHAERQERREGGESTRHTK
jgi:hypothetical protein